MLDQDKIKEQLSSWMITFLERPNPDLGNWPPCPYARQARIAELIDIKFSKIDDLLETVKSSFDLLEQKDVIIICFDHTSIDVSVLQDLVKEINDSIMDDNYVILEDHPNELEAVNGVQMNFTHCGLLLVQKLDKLNQASAQLRSKGYYNVWAKSELDSVVNWR
mgnify:CR=1 FL=1